jgi:hypothetical protein
MAICEPTPAPASIDIEAFTDLMAKHRRIAGFLPKAVNRTQADPLIIVASPFGMARSDATECQRFASVTEEKTNVSHQKFEKCKQYHIQNHSPSAISRAPSNGGLVQRQGDNAGPHGWRKPIRGELVNDIG